MENISKESIQGYLRKFGEVCLWMWAVVLLLGYFGALDSTTEAYQLALYGLGSGYVLIAAVFMFGPHLRDAYTDGALLSPSTHIGGVWVVGGIVTAVFVVIDHVGRGEGGFQSINPFTSLFLLIWAYLVFLYYHNRVKTLEQRIEEFESGEMLEDSDSKE